MMSEQKYIETNRGKIPISEYRDIMAMQNGYDSYEDMYRQGARLGNGYDIAPPKRVFIDMDGTLCRFHDTDHNYIERMWEKGFYIGLKPFEELVKAISLCADRNPDVEFYVLSAVLETEPPFAEDEKRQWVQEHIPQIKPERMIFVPAGADKASFIENFDKNCYLLDDYNKNLREWQNAGGTSIKFINDINNRGLGAYGGEKGNLWDGATVRHDESAMTLCLQLEQLTGIDRVEERGTAYYGFNGDVLPENFIELVTPYFEMRKQSDEDLRLKLSQSGETFSDYNHSAQSKQIVSQHNNNNAFVRAFTKEHKTDQAMLNCLEKAYQTAQANSIPLGKIMDWLNTAISRGTTWRTQPVTPTSVEQFISRMLKTEARLNELSSEIKQVDTDLKKCNRKFFIPKATEVAKDLVTDGKFTQTLKSESERLTDKLVSLQQEWLQLAHEPYPYVAQGKNKCKHNLTPGIKKDIVK